LARHEPAVGGRTEFGGDINHSSKEHEMRRNILHSLGLRVSMLTGLVLVLAAVMPLVALAGTGDPTGI
jgi:hypothetical protein